MTAKRAESPQSARTGTTDAPAATATTDEASAAGFHALLKAFEGQPAATGGRARTRSTSR